MATGKLFAIHAIIDQLHLYEVMDMLDGKAFDLKVATVKMTGKRGRPSLNGIASEHAVEEPLQNGHDAADDGEGRMSLREFLVIWIKKRKTFTSNEAISAAKAAGYKGAGVYGGIHVLLATKQVKRKAPGEYIVTGKPAPEKKKTGRPAFRFTKANMAAPKKAKKSAAKKTRAGPGNRVSDHIDTVLRRAHGAPMLAQAIRTGVERMGHSSAAVHSTLSMMVTKKRLIKVGKGLYQHPPEAATTPPPAAEERADTATAFI